MDYNNNGYDPNANNNYDPNAAAGYNAPPTPGYDPNQQYNPGGYNPNPYNPYGGGEDQNAKTMAIISLAAGILSIPVTLWVQAFVGLILAIAGIVLAAISMKKLTSSKGFAIGGLIASILGILIWIIAIAVVCCALSAIANAGYGYYY